MEFEFGSGSVTFMPKLVLTGADGEVRELEVEAGRTLMEALRDNGVGEILALCGGCCSCATCHVYVDQSLQAHLPPMTGRRRHVAGWRGA